MLALLALLALWFVFFATVMSSLQETHSQHNAYATFREQLTQLAPTTAPLGGVITPDAPVALIDAPSIGLKDVVIIEGTASGDLNRGPGHLRNTPLPGQPGNSWVMGRANALRWRIRPASTRLAQGIRISVTTGQGVAKYVVEDVRHVGDPYPGHPGRRSEPADAGQFRGRPLVQRLAAGPAGVPRRQAAGHRRSLTRGADCPAFPRPRLLMHGDSGALYTLVLWLPLLVLAGVLVVWLSDRWGRWHTWLVGAPVVLAALVGRQRDRRSVTAQPDVIRAR